MTSDAVSAQPTAMRRTQEEARVARHARAGDLDVGGEAQGEVDKALEDVELHAGERIEIDIDKDGTGADRGVTVNA